MLTSLMTAVLAAKLLAAAPRAPRDTTVNGTVALVTATKRELGSRKFHLAAAVSGAGDVTGALLDKSGRLACSFDGYVDLGSGCLTLVGCGVSGTRC